MADRHYAKAPITEAVLDIQVETVATPVAFDAMHAAEGERYPRYEALQAATGQLMIGPDNVPIASASSTPIGHLARAADGLQVYQSRTIGFAFSRMEPYPHWAVFRDEARRLWDTYRAIAQPSRITRLALRYINRIDMPLPVKDFGMYLRTAPQLSPDINSGLSAYFMQLNVPLPEFDAESVINQTIIPSPRPEAISVVLDIDVYKLVGMPFENDQLWEIFEQLRDAKNKVFEACITNETRKLFK